MRLRLRMLITLIHALFFRSRIGVFDTSVVNLVVWPNDVDVTQVTNDRYHAYMDIGRFDFIARAGLIPTMARRGWGPRSRQAIIRNRHPLKLMQRFQLHTSLQCWDENWFWFKQEFVYNGRTTSISYSKVGVSTKGKMVTTAMVLAAANQPAQSPDWPLLKQLDAVEESLRLHQR